MKKLSEPLASILLILGVCFLSFGVFIPQLGFYWDDFASLYVVNQQGTDVFTAWSAGQARPLAGLFSGWMWELAGARPLAWHGFHFVLYVLSVLLFWRSLRLLWGGYRPQTTLMALLFAVYPSYHLRPIPISFELILSLNFFLLSFWLSLWAARRGSLGWALLAAALVPVYQLTYEQNLVYEALRPLAMWMVLGFSVQNLRPLARLWAGFVVAGLGLVVYRLVLFQPSETYGTYNTLTVSNVLLLFKLSIAEPFKILVVDWVALPWRFFTRYDIDVPATAATLALLACLFYLWRWGNARLHSAQTAGWVGVVGVGIISGLLLAIHLVGRVLQDGFNSRWALSPSLMAAVVLGVVVPRLVRSAHLGQMILALLVALGVAVQVQVSKSYAEDWALRRDLFWQLRWRAPALEPQTMFVLVTAPDTFAFDRQLNDYELSAHASAHYSSPSYPAIAGATSANLKSLVSNRRPTRGNWALATSGYEVIFRNWEFDLDKLLVFGYDGSCLLTADASVFAQNMPNADYHSLARLHQPSAIRAVPLAESPPPTALAEPEPAHGWCFYYQQVQWALQFGDDATLRDLLATFAAQGVAAPKDHEAEWIPFVLAYNRLGDYAQAERLLQFFRLGKPHAQQALCDQLHQLEPHPAIEAQKALLPGC